jgi:hypothetical protein
MSSPYFRLQVPRLNVTPQGRVPRLDYSGYFEREAERREERRASMLAALPRLTQRIDNAAAHIRSFESHEAAGIPRPETEQLFKGAEDLGFSDLERLIQRGEAQAAVLEACVDRVHAMRERRQDLIRIMSRQHPGKSEAEVLAILDTMHPIERCEMWRNDGHDVAPDRYHTGGDQEPPALAYDADNMGVLPLSAPASVPRARSPRIIGSWYK